ncbi:outer membrane receptor protein [Bernardetia litoralis DSM 6794]|uniref:Outer membrane receptor protein n=1 Tax=Bernardetia litoralis (strain ATCC 23117 / DSM 6794 / NBRC 15988 / NCIMB 1366 / Fx l1 / Sio-4) TaxID=880071 RepID=I4AJN9_BERLS|nr:TonB-dependent receptor [Bernardetia litoralis]AFM04174.1 outer membrane receptor protein [Bernardetia litoralis DSM 6794]
MKKILLTLFLLIGFSANAQFVIQGQVFDSQTQESIVGATIQLVETTKGTVTNADGTFKYETNIDSDSIDIKISSIGYESKTMTITNGQYLSISIQPSFGELQSIVVTANRDAALRTESPVAISKLSSRLIDETKPTSVYEIVNKTPGVLMVNLNNEQHSMSIRQPMNYSGYSLYLEDGLPIRPLGVFNHNALLEINQFAISSIEVVKGPVSSIYGAEAVGGAINFITQRPTAVPTARIGVQFDQFGYRRLQFGAGAKIGKLGVYIGGLTSTQKDSWLDNSDYDKTSVNVRLDYHFTPKTRLIATTVYGNYDSQTSKSADSIAFYNREYSSTSAFTYRKSEVTRSRLTLEHDWSVNSKTSVTVFNRFNSMGQLPSYRITWNAIDPTVATGEKNENSFQSYGVLAQHSYNFDFLDSKLIIGGMYDYSPNDYWAYQLDLNVNLRADGTSVEEYTIKEERPDIKVSEYDAIIQSSAAYVQYDFEPIKKLRFSLGMRYDRMSFEYDNFLDQTDGNKSYSQFTPKVGLTYDLGNDKGLYANYAQGFSPPSLTTIFRPRPKENVDDPTEFYYDLDPAVFKNYEVGGWAAFWENKLYIDVALYQLMGQNELISMRLPNGSYEYRSAGETLHRGIEVGLTLRPVKQILIRTGGTYALHRFEEFQISALESDDVQNLSGFEMPSAPNWIWNSEINYYPKWAKGLRTALEWQYVSGWYENQVNTLKYEGYNLLNFRIGYQWKGIEVFTNVMNLTDELYATTVSRGNTSTSIATFTPSAPRTFMMGIQYNFVGKK